MYIYIYNKYPKMSNDIYTYNFTYNYAYSILIFVHAYLKVYDSGFAHVYMHVCLCRSIHLSSRRKPP